MSSIENDADFVKDYYGLSDPLTSKKYVLKKPFVKVFKNGMNFDDEFKKEGFKSPFYFRDCEGLDMKMPLFKENLENLLRHCGGDRIVPAVESISQKVKPMRLEEYIKEFRKEENSLNLLSLEVSDTYLDKKVLGPNKVYEMDWVKNAYPDSYKPQGPGIWTSHPKIAKYCLLSSKGSFTDFHIDFGGTSVWYHVLKGKKIFWLVKPTDENLELYKNWKLKSSDSSFFGDVVKECQRVELKENSLFLMPSGWIHGVYTPEKSIVFGGNFLHFDAIKMQLKITKLQNEEMNIPIENRFPNQIRLYWYVADYVVRCCGGRSYIDQNVLNDSTNVKKVKKKTFTESQITELSYLVEYLKTTKKTRIEGITSCRQLYNEFNKVVIELSNSTKDENDSEDDMPLIGFKETKKSISKEKVLCKLRFELFTLSIRIHTKVLLLVYYF